MLLTILHMCSYLLHMIDPLDPKSLQPAREAAKVSRAALASKAGVSETTVLRIESGGVDPRLDGTWAPLVRALQAIVDERSTGAPTAAAA
jgi:predicted transcriptional regulator